MIRHLFIVYSIFIPPFLFSEDRNAIIKGKIQGKEDLEGAWIHAIPASAPSPEIKKAGAYHFLSGYGIWYRPQPVDPDGQFELHLPHGRYYLRAGAKGYEQKVIMIDATVHNRVEVKPIELKWLGISRLRIRALFEDGTPVSERMVMLLLRCEETEEEVAFSTDDEGYGWVDVIPNVYRVSLKSPLPASSSYFSNVRLEPGRLSDVVLRIGGGGWIHGRVRNNEGVIPGARIEAIAIDASQVINQDSKFIQTWSDGVSEMDGTFFIGPLKPGRYVLVARRPGLLFRFSNPISVSMNETVREVNLPYVQKDPGIGGLIIRVFKDTPTGPDPIGGVQIHARVEASEYFPEKQYKAISNALGYAGISSINVGKVYLEAIYHSPDGSSLYGTTEAELSHGEQTEACIQLIPVEK